MTAFFAWMHQNPVYWTAVVIFLHHCFDAAVDSLPQPQAMSSPWYQFVYAFANKLAGNYRLKGQL